MYRVEIDYKTGYTFVAKAGDREFVIDAKAEEGLSPPQVLLASLASCMGVYLRKYLEGSNLKVPTFKITAEAEFSQTPQMSFKVINVLINLQDAQIDERRRKVILE